MARILFAWEIGGEFGHVVACSSLARALALRGHRIAFAFRELRQVAFVGDAQGYELFQAPRCANEGIGVGLPANCPEILLGCGYADERELAALLGGWRSIMARWRPDLVVCDYAPTALLAARTLALPRVTYGNGFFTPPRLSPIPSYRVNEPVDHARVAHSDARTLQSVNLALARFGVAPLDQLARMFEADEDFLCTFPELDHYGMRPASGYWGPRLRFDLGKDVAWPAGTGARIFVYVKRFMPHLDALIDYLARSPHRVIAFIPDLDAARRKRLEGPRRLLSERPVRLDTLMRQCDLLVSHGGEIAAGALMHGVPSLLFPTHYEQYLTAQRLKQLGASTWIHADGPAGAIPAAVDALLRGGAAAGRARAFAGRYAAFSPKEQRRRIAARIEELLAARAAALPSGEAPPILGPSPAKGPPP